MESSIESPKQRLNSTWKRYGKLLINQGLFKKGVIVVLTNEMEYFDSSFAITKTSIPIKERELVFNSKSINSKISKATQKSVKKAQNLFLQIAPHYKGTSLIFNANRREEIFFPLIFKDEQENIGSYIYPWTSQTLESNFNGFENFVTCGCLFGANLKAVDENKRTFPLIKHEKLDSKVKIKHILYDSTAANPYEETLFIELKKFTLMVNELSTKNKPKHLVYHLPYYDYVLFGINLYVNAKINLDQLHTFVDLIFSKAMSYEVNIRNICSVAGIAVSIQSPFDNLFGNIKNDNNPNKTEKILNTLGLSLDESYYAFASESKKNHLVAELVQLIQHKLKTNDYDSCQQVVWRDFLISQNGHFQIDNLESLLKLANAVMLGLTATNKGHNQTCSLLPLTEKQIQVQYASIQANLFNAMTQGETLYPVIFNITTLDPIISYSLHSNGNLFYLDEGQKTLSDLIINKKILQTAYKNLSLFSNKDSHGDTSIGEGDKPVTLEEVFSLSKP